MRSTTAWKRTPWIGPLVLAASLTACRAGTPAAHPLPRLSAAARDAERAAPRSGGDTPGARTAVAPVPAEGWTLEAVLARIREANPNLAVAEARVAEARAALDEAGAADLPRLTLSQSYLITDEPGTAFGLLLNQQRLSLGPGFDPTPGNVENHRTRAVLEWALFRPGRREGKRAAAAGLQAAEYAREAAERRLLNSGVQAWILLAAARDLEAAARDRVAVVEARLKTAKERVAAGAALQVEVLRLEARLAEARQGVAAAARNRKRAEAALDVLMGLPADTPVEIAAYDAQHLRARPLPATLERALAEARTGRKDLLAKAFELSARAEGAAAARATRLPSLAAFGSAALDSPDLGFDKDLSSFQAGLVLSWSLDPGREARIRKAESRLRRARRAYQAYALTVGKEVKDAWDAWELARQDLALARKAEAAAVEAWRVVARAFDSGAATATDLLSAERARSAAVRRRTAAEAALSLAEIRLIGTLGGIR